jgi:hypothetical protein
MRLRGCDHRRVLDAIGPAHELAFGAARELGNHLAELLFELWMSTSITPLAWRRPAM